MARVVLLACIIFIVLCSIWNIRPHIWPAYDNDIQLEHSRGIEARLPQSRSSVDHHTPAVLGPRMLSNIPGENRKKPRNLAGTVLKQQSDHYDDQSFFGPARLQKYGHKAPPPMGAGFRIGVKSALARRAQRGTDDKCLH